MKKLLSLAMAGVLAFSVAACGSNETPAAGDNAAPEATEGNASEAAEGNEAGGADAAAPADGAVLKIGGIGPTTGGAAVYGQAVMNAANLAVEEINAAGGINGMQVAFQFEDDEHDAEKSVNAYNTLKDWGMQMLMGTVTSTPCTAVVAKTAEDNMFQLTPSGSAVESIAQPNAFRICFSDPNQGAASAQYIGENKVATKVAVIYDSSDVYSTGIYEKFAAEAANQGIEIVAAEAFTADSKTDFSVQLQKANEAGAELVFLPALPRLRWQALQPAHCLAVPLMPCTHSRPSVKMLRGTFLLSSTLSSCFIDLRQFHGSLDCFETARIIVSQIDAFQSSL